MGATLRNGSAGDEEYAHSREHSREFAAVLLRSVWSSGQESTAVFVLLGSLFTEDGVDADRLKRMNRLADAIAELKDAETQRDRRVMVIAAADLSHVGARFGGDAVKPEDDLGWLEAVDREELKILVEDGAEAFLEKCREHGNSRNVCGIPALYVARKAEDAKRGLIAAYEQSREPETLSVITMTSAWMG